MTEISEIDVAESIKTKRLVFQGSAWDLFDRLYLYFLCIALIFATVLMMSIIEPEFFLDKLEKFFLLPASILLILYVMYRGYNEDRLLTIDTPHGKEVNVQLLVEYLSKEELEFTQGEGYLIARKYNFFSLVHGKSIVILVQDKFVMVTVFTHGLKLNIPTLIYHILLRDELADVLSKPKLGESEA